MSDKDKAPKVAPPPPPAPAAKTAEEAELERLMKEEEEAKAAALAAVEAAAAAEAVAAAKASAASVTAVAPPVQKKAAGDVLVVCLKDEPHVRLGSRSYAFKKGAEIEMLYDHAVEMEQSGWVIRRK